SWFDTYIEGDPYPTAAGVTAAEAAKLTGSVAERLAEPRARPRYRSAWPNASRPTSASTSGRWPTTCSTSSRKACSMLCPAPGRASRADEASARRRSPRATYSATTVFTDRTWHDVTGTERRDERRG